MMSHGHLALREAAVSSPLLLLLFPHLLRGCDGALHARGGLRGVDRGLPSVRSARGLQGRQELGRMLVCVTDFVLPQTRPR